jgi:hypothetical protein
VHPNRVTGRSVSRRETETYSAHFAAFFDPQGVYPARSGKPPPFGTRSCGRADSTRSARFTTFALCGAKRSPIGRGIDRSSEGCGKARTGP